MKTSQFKKRKRRGSILVLTLFILVILAILGTAFVVLIPVEMRNAQKDRAVVQASYGADAAVRFVMNELRNGVDYQDISNSTVDMGGGWQYRVDNIELLANDEYRVSTSGLLRGLVKRRAVAIIDNANINNSNAIVFTDHDVDGAQIINPQGAWPVNVPVTGNVFIQGTWHLDRSGVGDLSTISDPPINGRIYHTDPSGGGLRGEENTGGNLAAGDYQFVYENGQDAIQPYGGQLEEENLLLQDQVRGNLLSEVFGVDSSTAETLAGNVSDAFEVPNNSGTMAGGIYVNPGGAQKGNQPGACDVVLSVDGNGNGVITVTNSEQTTTFTFITEGGTYGSTTVPAGQDRLYVENVPAAGGGGSGGGGGKKGGKKGGGGGKKGGKKGGGGGGGGTSSPTTAMFDGDFSQGNVVYIDAAINSIEGEHKGNHTIAAADAITITNDILKSDTPRGREPNNDSTDTLGLIACADSGNSSPGFSIAMDNNTTTWNRAIDQADVHENGGQGDGQPDGNMDSDEFFVYSYITSLSKTDGNAKMLSNNQHPSLPQGKTMSLIGNLTWAPTTPGHINTGMNFIETWNQVILDENTPIAFPNPIAEVFIPQIRSYVDLPVAE